MVEVVSHGRQPGLAIQGSASTCSCQQLRAGAASGSSYLVGCEKDADRSHASIETLGEQGALIKTKNVRYLFIIYSYV